MALTNTELLMEEINASNIPRTALAAAWGMSMPTFYSRVSGESEFKASEIVAAAMSLKLSKKKRDAIFLAD